MSQSEYNKDNALISDKQSDYRLGISNLFSTNNIVEIFPYFII